MKNEAIEKLCFVVAIFIHVLFLFAIKEGRLQNESITNYLDSPLKVELVYLANKNSINHKSEVHNLHASIPNPLPITPQGSFLTPHSASFQGDPVYLLYLNYWKKKVEKAGSFNYPAKVSFLNRISPIDLLVTLNRDGQVKDTKFLQNSGDAAIDQAILNSVRLAAPFLPPPLSMQQGAINGIEILTHWKLETTASHASMEFVDAGTSRIY